MEKLLTEGTVSVITGRSTSTLQKDRVAGTGIPYVKIGRQVRYRELDVAAFCAERVRRSTSEPGQSEAPRHSNASGNNATNRRRHTSRPGKAPAPISEELAASPGQPNSA